jgi:putative FmdB family regulatory protein
MPIFEFRCKKCEREFEFFIMKKGEAVVCPFCGGEEVEKLISSFRLGGSGGEGTLSSGACSTCSSKNCSTCK